MSIDKIELVRALRRTAKNIQGGAAYQWGHMGCCNCGHLAQVLTPFSKGQIHEFAMQRSGDWSEQVLDYCPSSGYPMDLLITKLLEVGLTKTDLHNLEYLSDQKIIARVGRHLKRNDRKDVSDYLKAWASILEDELLDPIEINKDIAQGESVQAVM